MSQLPPPLRDARVPRLVLQVLERLRQRGFEAYLVGGCVRDYLRGLAPKDYDVATNARPAEVQRVFPRVIPTGIDHGTVTVLVEDERVEVTTYRTEADYADGRRPSRVEFHHAIDADLSRRDFTINAMAFDPLGAELLDPFGGQDDLARGLVRTVGEPLARFGEDGLRALRAVRFAAVLDFSLHEATEEAIPSSIPVFQRVALERVRDELIKLLLSDGVERGCTLLLRTGLLESFLPELAATSSVELGPPYSGDLFAHSVWSAQATPADVVLRLAGLLHDLGKVDIAAVEGRWRDHEARSAALSERILERLKFSRRQLEQVSLLVREHDVSTLLDAPASALRRKLAVVGEANGETLMDLAAANVRGRGGDVAQPLEAVEGLRARVESVLAERPPLTTRALALDGRAIMEALGVGPSPVVGEATRYLLDQVLDEPSRNTPEALRVVLSEWGKR